MSQAYPQFTPVQILEAGQRAFGEGRTDYAAQFFQHLIEHYGDTAEAAAARDTMAQINGASPAGARAQSQTQPQAQPAHRNGAAHATPSSSGPRPAPGYAQAAVANGAPQGIQLNVNGAHGHHKAQPNGHLNGHDANGHATSLSAHDNQARSIPQHYQDPSFGRSPRQPAPLDVRHHMTRPNDVVPSQSEAPVRAVAVPHRVLVPAPEKNYIIGRVIAGLLLLIGIVGILAGIVLVYAAVTDPGIYAAIGIATPSQALLFSGSVFVGSIVALMASQMATAVFDGADAVSDLARLERYKTGDVDEE